MPRDLVLLSTLNGSNYPCLELIFMVHNMFKPLKFDCNLVKSESRLMFLILSTSSDSVSYFYTFYV